MSLYKVITPWRERAKDDNHRKLDTQYADEEIASLRGELAARGIIDQPMNRSTGMRCPSCYSRKGDPHTAACTAPYE